MVYDPSGRSRTVSGVFPRALPFNSTSAPAGVDRISKLPLAADFARDGAAAMAPDAGRDGVGGGKVGAGAAGADCGGFAGKSTVVASTADGLSTTGTVGGGRLTR
jgi:hypothetical protein